MDNVYKIFNDDAVLHIISESDLNSYKNSGFYEIRYVDEHSVLNLPEKFINGDPCSHLLITEAPEKTLNAIKKQFKYIEAAGGVVFNEHNEILIIFRRGKFDLPKGKCEPEESVKETAVREVMEECGVSGLKITGKLPSTYHMYHLKNKMVLKKTWWFKMYAPKQQLKPQTEEDIVRAQWQNANDFDKFLENTYATLKELLVSVDINYRR